MKKIVFNILSWLMLFLCTFGFVIALSFVFSTSTVVGHSMDNSLKEGELLIIQKEFIEYNYGDIVLTKKIKLPDGSYDSIVKRIIAMEGDTIEIKDGVLYINGKKQYESYIKENMKNESYKKVKLKKNEVYLMGDNRNNSYDSRQIGPIKISKLQGKVIFIKL